MLWVGAVLAMVAAVLLAFVPRLPSADRSHGFGLSSGSLRITGSTNRRLRVFAVTQIAASFVLLAGAGMLLKTLLALQSRADRLRHAPRARGERAGDVVRTHAGTGRWLLPGSDAAHHGAARRRSGRGRHAGAVARCRRLRSRLRSSRPMATSARPAKTIRARDSAPSRPDSSRRSACPIIAGRDFNDSDRRGQRAGRDRQPEPGAAACSRTRTR